MEAETLKDDPVNDEKRSLQQLIDSTPNLVEYLFNETLGTHTRVRFDMSPVPVEVSNWRDEQRAWRETAVLFDQTHHMPELFLSGPDALRLLNHLGVNSLTNLQPGVAKQFVACNESGQMIGECILHDLSGTYELISGKPLLNWVRFHAETGDYDVTYEVDEATWDNTTGRRRNFRYQIDGPNGGMIFDKLVEGEVPTIPFFRSTKVTIAGVEVMAFRHGMAGHRGYEISGPFEAGEAVREAILAAGEEHGIRAAGQKAYFTGALESGWVSYPIPAIYTDDRLRAYREWLPADEWEGNFDFGGSFFSENIEDYYTTPFDLGLSRVVKFDHDFIGRDALQRIAEAPPRTKVALAWNTDDVLRIYASQFSEGPAFKSIRFPASDYAQMQRDEVRAPDGRLIGLSTHGGYTVNEKTVISHCIIDAEFAEPGTEVIITWGEPGGGSRKPFVERHEQTTVRATVESVPFASTVRTLKRSDFVREDSAQR